MVKRLPLTLSVLAAGLAGLGCEVLFGVHELTLTEAPPQGCAPPSPRMAGSGIRIGNLSGTELSVDLCAAPSGQGFGRARPLIRWSGASCAPGIRYKELSVPLGIAPGVYDLKLVKAGRDCTAAGVATTLVAQALPAESVTTILLFGDGQQEPLVLRALPDTLPDGQRTLIRFVNGVQGAGALDCGGTDENSPPSLSSLKLVFQNVNYTNVAAPHVDLLYPIDERGYLSFGGVAPQYDFGIAPSGTRQLWTSLPTSQYFERAKAYTLFSAGSLDHHQNPIDLWVCNEGPSAPNQVLAVCGDPRELSTEVFSAQLSDLFTADIDERTKPVIDAIRRLDSDIVCLNEIERPADVAAAIRAARENGHYNAVISASDYVADAPPDLVDQNGTAMRFLDAPCNSTDAPLLHSAMHSIANSNCVTEDLAGAHVFLGSGTTPVSCLFKSAEALGALLSPPESDPPEGRQRKLECYACAITKLAGYSTLEEAEQVCVHPPANPDNPKEQFVFNGTPGLLILSHFPLAGSPELKLLPSTGWQRGILRAPLRINNGEVVDFYCSVLNVFAGQQGLPYTGRFGNGAIDTMLAAENEQLLETHRILDFIQTRSGSLGRPVIAGLSLYAGIEQVDSTGRVLVKDYRPAVYRAAVEGDLKPLVAASFTPTCNVCSEGGNSTPHGIIDTWTTHLFGQRIYPEDVLSTQMTHTEKVVTAPGGLIPISQHFGVRSVLRIRQ